MLNSIKLKIGQSIRNKKLNVFGLFFLIAFLILVVTKLSENYVETIPLSIEYKNLPETNVITLDSIPKVNVTVSTHGFNLFSYYFYDKTYILDFENSTDLKDNTYLWVAEKGRYAIKEQFGNSVEIVSVKPDTLVFPFGKLSTKKVPVILKSKINFRSGYDVLNEIVLIPDSVKIIGAEEEISEIEFIETKPFDLSDVKTNINTLVDLEFVNASKHLKLSAEKIRIKAEVDKFTEGTFKIPITILNKPNKKDVNFFPKHITVSYYISLKDYKHVTPNDFKIECDYNEVLKSGNPYFTPKLIVNSSKVKSAKMKQNKVEYIIIK
ncbi:CdaR family protein [uncultured Psychroserpens sp.]|uniref:CdaR family protein n=1 Tax=uncultured Psychroserpens sp. TaxID=255436 RepID=UPI0026229F5E|nr:CdaR family protein [uncultured Psychroserpens sp.]